MPENNNKKEKSYQKWIDFKKLGGKYYKPARVLAYYLNDHESHSINITDLSIPKPPKDVFDQGIITNNSGELSFYNDYYYQFALAEYIIIRDILPLWNKNDSKILEILTKQNRKYLRVTKKNELTAHILFLLNKDYEKNVVKFIGRQAENANDFWSIYSPFCKVFHKLDFQIKDLLESLIQIQKTSQGTITTGSIYSSLETIAEVDSHKADEIYGQLVDKKDPNLTYFIPNILKGLAVHNFNKVYSRALELVKSDTDCLQIAGILTLGSLKYEEAEKEINQVLDLLKKCENTTNEYKSSALVRTYHNLILQGIDTSECITRMSEQNIDRVQSNVSHCLVSIQKKFKDESWFKKTLLNLSIIDPKMTGVVNDIDQILRKYVDYNIGYVVSFFESWITHREYLNVPQVEQVTELFGSTFAEIKNSGLEINQRIITSWFSSEDPKLHTAASNIVHSYGLFSKDENPIYLSLNTKILDNLKVTEVKYVALKIMGYIIDAHQLCSLVFSILKRNEVEEEIILFVIEALSVYVIYNYPNRKNDYLNEKLQRGSTIEKEVADKVLTRIEEYHDARDNLPQLKELQAPTEHLRSFRKARFKQNQKIQEEAEKRSVFRQVVTNVPIKYGRSIFTYREGQVTKRSYMGQYSHSVEIPRGELIDPLGQQILRFNWRIQNKNDVS